MSEASEQGRTARPSSAAERRSRRASAQGEPPASVANGRGSSKGRATPARNRKQKRPNIVKRIVRFLREVVSELRKVIWPTRKMLVTYTAVVLVFVSVMVALVFGLDTAFNQVIGLLLGN